MRKRRVVGKIYGMKDFILVSRRSKAMLCDKIYCRLQMMKPLIAHYCSLSESHVKIYVSGTQNAGTGYQVMQN